VSKGKVKVVHIYPREMSIYGDLGNTRALASRLRWHGYEPVVHQHHPGNDFPTDAHLVLGGGGQDSGQARVEDDLAHNGEVLRALATWSATRTTPDRRSSRRDSSPSAR